MHMDKYESRRIALKRLVDFMGHGAIATIATEIGKSPSYVSRMLYEPGKPGAKRIGEDMLELLADTYPEAFTQEVRMFAVPSERTTNLPETEQDIAELRALLGMTVQALAASTPIAGRELAAAMRKRFGPPKGRFADDLVKTLESELSEVADTFPRKHSARRPR